MKAKKVLQISWVGLTRNKLRSMLTMLGVIIGVAAVIVMVSISAGTEATIAEEINSLGANLLFVSMGMSPGRAAQDSSIPILTLDDAYEIRDGVSGVVGVSTERSSVETVRAGSVVLEEVTLVGTTPDYPAVRDIEIDTGRFFNTTELDRKSKVVILGFDLAQSFFGDEDPIGQSITVGTTK